MLLPTSLGLALEVFPALQRGTAVGIWAAVGAVAAGSGPVLGGLLVESSWRWIFLINLPVILGALAAGVAILPRRPRVRATVSGPPAHRRRGNGLGAGRGGPAMHRADRGTTVAAVAHLAGTGRRAGAWGPGSWPTSVAARIRWSRHGSFRCALSVPVLPGSSPTTPALRPCSWARRCCSPGHGTFSVLHAAASIAPGPITAGIVSPFSGRLSARFGVRGTVVAGAVFFAAAGAWLLASAGDSPAYAAVVLPAMLLWGVANALIQPSLFACAGAAPRADLASGAAVLATARQLGAALGVATFVAVLGGRAATGLAGFDRAWLIVVITAVITAFAGPRHWPAADRYPRGGGGQYRES